MTTLLDAHEVATGPTPRGRRLRRVALAAALVLLVAGGIVATVWVRHYSAAAALNVEGGVYQPLPGVGGSARYVQTGSVNVSEIEVSRHHQQGFELWVHNPSPVTQRILGLSPSSCCASESRHLLVGTRDPTGDGDGGPFVARPVAIPPGEFRAVRMLTTVNACWRKGTSSTITDLYLRVQVGGFTRDEIVPIDSLMTVVIDQEHPNTC